MNSATSTHSISVADFERTLSLISTEGLPLLVLGRKATKFTDIPHALSLAQAAVNAGTDVYFSLATVTGNTHETYGHTLRNSANLVSYGALFAELDCGEGKPFNNRDQAYGHLQAIISAGLPAPTHVVNSGGGLHLYWKLDAPLAADEFAAILPVWKATLQRFGLQFDAAALLPTQILRVAGTFNFKHGQVRPVEFLGSADVVYNYASLAQWMQAVYPDVPRAVPMDQRINTPANAIRFEIDWLREELSKLEPDCTREAWLAVGFGLAGETACSDEGYALWNDWSMGALTGMPVPSYSEEACWKFWSSAQDSRSTAHAWGPGVTERLFARQETEVTNARAETMARMLATTNVAAQAINLDAPQELPRPNPLGVAPITVQAAVLPEGLLEDAARGQAAAKRSEAAKERAAELALKMDEFATQALNSGVPECLQPYCSINDTTTYYNWHTGAICTAAAFDQTLEKPLSQLSTCPPKKIPASSQARMFYNLPAVGGFMYRPAEGMLIHYTDPKDGKERVYANSARLDGRVTPATEWTPAGLEQKMWIERHVLEVLSGGRSDVAQRVMDFFMWYGGKPGQRLGAMLILCGASGIGKSIMKNAIERSYPAGTVNSTKIDRFIKPSEFDMDRVQGSLTVIDEGSTNADDNHLAIDNMKPYITEPTLSLMAKGGERHPEHNHMTYLMTMNNINNLRIPDTDRRTTVVDAPWKNIADLNAFMLKEFGIEQYNRAIHDVFNRDFDAPQFLLMCKEHVFGPGFGVGVGPLDNPERHLVAERRATAHADDIDHAFYEATQCDGTDQAKNYRGVTSTLVSVTGLFTAIKSVSLAEDAKFTLGILRAELRARGWLDADKLTNSLGHTVSRIKYEGNQHSFMYASGQPLPTYDDIKTMMRVTFARWPGGQGTPASKKLVAQANDA